MLLGNKEKSLLYSLKLPGMTKEQYLYTKDAIAKKSTNILHLRYVGFYGAMTFYQKILKDMVNQNKSNISMFNNVFKFNIVNKKYQKNNKKTNININYKLKYENVILNKYCNYCYKNELKLKRCKYCKAVYCSKQCQKSDWKINKHYKTCNRV